MPCVLVTIETLLTLGGLILDFGEHQVRERPEICCTFFRAVTCFVYIAHRMLRRMADGVRLTGLGRQGGLLPDASTTYDYAAVSHIK
jgi:hypothetical protein